jgi:hypothetical protein
MHGTTIYQFGKVVAFSDRCPRALFLSLVVESGGGGGEDQKVGCVCVCVCGCHCVCVSVCALCGM